MRILNMQKWTIKGSDLSSLFIRASFASRSLICVSFIFALITGASYVHAQDATDFQEVKQVTYQPQQDNLVYLQSDQGLVVIELAPFIAPNHVAQFKALVNEGFYNGLDFYRVIDGFVAQGGDVTEKKPSKYSASLAAEFTRALTSTSNFVTVQSPEFLAQETGFMQGFPSGRSLTDKQEWLLHCPGAVAMARNNEANSGSTDFYIVIGQAPRHLDRNMSVFGQVIYGMENVQAMKRGNPNVDGGVINDVDQRTKIVSKAGHQRREERTNQLHAQLSHQRRFSSALAKCQNLRKRVFSLQRYGQY
jgi:peptidylprolyl isomerase